MYRKVKESGEGQDCQRYWLDKHPAFKFLSHLGVNDRGRTANLISACRSRRATLCVPNLDFKLARLLKNLEEITNENMAGVDRLYITLTWMSDELLIYYIKTFYGCITIYLSISNSPGQLPWGFSHIQSRPLWHTLLSLFKYPVTSPSGPGTQRHVIKSSISPQPGLPSCACGDRLIFFGWDPLQEITI